MQQTKLLELQFRYLAYLKKLSERELRNLHNELFIGSKYAQKIPKFVHRDKIEQRLWLVFCMRNYHYPKGHPVRVNFFKNAKKVLSTKLYKDKEEELNEHLKKRERFSKSAINAMTSTEVDRYLTALNIHIEGGDDIKRRCLYEWYNLPQKDLIADDPELDKQKKGLNKLHNKYNLRSLILQYPLLDFDTFKLNLGHEMPTVSRASFNNTRSLLRKAGYKVPKLSAPGIVRRTKQGHLRVGNVTEFDDTNLQVD